MKLAYRATNVNVEESRMGEGAVFIALTRDETMEFMAVHLTADETLDLITQLSALLSERAA